MSISLEEWAVRARAALIVAASRRSLVTYGEPGRAIGWNPDVPISHHARRILDAVSKVCHERGEPSLAAIVVGEKTGRPGSGWWDGSTDGSGWMKESARVFARPYIAAL